MIPLGMLIYEPLKQTVIEMKRSLFMIKLETRHSPLRFNFPPFNKL